MPFTSQRSTAIPSGMIASAVKVSAPCSGMTVSPSITELIASTYSASTFSTGCGTTSGCGVSAGAGCCSPETKPAFFASSSCCCISCICIFIASRSALLPPWHAVRLNSISTVNSTAKNFFMFLYLHSGLFGQFYLLSLNLRAANRSAARLMERTALYFLKGR